MATLFRALVLSICTASSFLVVSCVAVAGPARAYVNPATGGPSPRGVVRGFDNPPQNWLPGHRGVDLDASVGQAILSAGSGRVAFAGTVAGVPAVSVDHAGGIRTTYQPVAALVREGEEVAEGQPIGTLLPTTDGSRGLHWGARTGPNEYVNPLGLLAPPKIRLKPQPGG